ncbi:MAG: class I SAM-dependent methyltransferase [Solirubrobacterales bacterium]|nr:class I SAM-dependent methyltransferase [Solirubrobacterales bacterium]
MGGTLVAGPARARRSLAARGWQVTAVDFAATALARARSTAEAMGPEVAERVAWVEADLGTWTPGPEAYDLVVCLYVHVAGPVEERPRPVAGTGVDAVVRARRRMPTARQPRA